MRNFQYGANLKLKHKRDLALVFEKGKWKTCGNLRIVYVNPEQTTGPKIGVSVSKRYFKKSVDRNRIKRLLREAYRLNKEQFHNRFGESCFCMIFWVSKDLPTHFSTVETDFLRLCRPKH